jgi:hypothetical protein
MSLEEYGIDRYKVPQLFKEGPRGPKGPDGVVYDGSGQILIRERLDLTSSTQIVTQDVLAHTIQPGEIDRFNDSILIMVVVQGTGVAFPISTCNLIWERGATRATLLTTSASPVNMVSLVEIQVDPFDVNSAYITTNPGQFWSTNRNKVTIGEDWIRLGGQLLLSTNLGGGGAIGSWTAIYMLKKAA